MSKRQVREQQIHWTKKGLIFCAKGQFEWMQSHATVPTPLHLSDDIFRIFFSTRNALNQNQVGFVEIDINDPSRILAISETPVISIGPLGYFDCDGVYATSLVRDGGKLYFYYAGWNAGLRGLFYSAIGVAISDDNGNTFHKYLEVPILARDAVDKWAVMAPFVMKDGDVWKMWYASGLRLSYHEGGKLKSQYDIKYALSYDGFNWKKTGTTSISLGERDSNIARACILKDHNLFRSWYPYVSNTIGHYRIGYAESADGEHFTRLDERAGIDVSGSGWDSDAVTYPFVFEHKGRKYMLYNGNEFGKTGFGLAFES
jgi:predicted GH43/DUF377 family glycosyl hydrolase